MAFSGQFMGSADYIADKDLTIAVNAAIALERPLLVKGEPGTGKTELARQVASALGLPMIRMEHQIHHQGAARALRIRCRVAVAR
ncbi:MoxR-like ATPase [Rhizobium taibaishanense]|uniref:MoxR-like ATPase n=1 Tax=Allorhizobium taibaishanense TaxID=887144 RepID=A0A7W6MVG3_9HYPH|nr:MoxR-like ATPase [Allorhizobium taibaishanense]